MAVDHDGESNLTARTTATGAGPFTVTASGKTTAGSNRYGVVRFMTSGTVTSVTWDGVAMDLIQSTTRAAGTLTIAAYGIVAPPTAGSDVVITVTAPVEVTYTVSSYNGVDQVDAIGNTATNSGSTANGSVVVTSAVDHLVLDAFDVANVASVGADQTEEGSNLGGGDEFGASREAGAASVTMSWTHGAADWGTVGFSLNAVTAAGQPFFTQLGGQRL